MTTIRKNYTDGSLLLEKKEEDNDSNAKAIINPFTSPYYNDSMSSTPNKDDVTVAAAKTVTKDKANGPLAGWNHADTSAPAAKVDDLTKIPKANSSAISSANNVILNDGPVDAEEVISLLDAAYDQVSVENQAEVEAIVADIESGPDLLQRRMEALSKKIDEALRAETPDYDLIHSMVLRFCMIHMRNVVKEDQRYIDEINKRIKTQSGVIRESYNTWPVVCITLVSSATSIVGGVAGFSTLVQPSSVLAQSFARNSQQISTMSTGISGAGSLLNSRNEGDRRVLELFLKRDQDKEEEKKGTKHGSKDSQKGLRDAINEASRNRHDTVGSILR